MLGGCLCGAVRFEAEPAEPHCHACHCEMCRRWTGTAFVAVPVPRDSLRFEDETAIRRFRSSDWAERAFCGSCGSSLYYGLTLEAPEAAQVYVSLGLFDEPDGFDLGSELFIDAKPAGYSFAGERPRSTRAEFEAMFGGDGG